MIYQLSVFLENKFGRLNERLRIIAHENVRIVASTVSDTTEFGILRLIVTDPERTEQALRKHNISVKKSEVLAISIANDAGALVAALEPFTAAGISIEYMYSFCTGKDYTIVMRVNNRDAALEVVRRHDLKYLTETDILNF
jgi:hypothetical protein